MTPEQIESAFTAVAFTRAFITNDSKGCEKLLAAMPVDTLPNFVSAMALLTHNALTVGGVPISPFMDSMLELIESKAP